MGVTQKPRARGVVQRKTNTIVQTPRTFNQVRTGIVSDVSQRTSRRV